MNMPNKNEILMETRTFWNTSPCGGQNSFSKRLNHRMFMEPWIADLIEKLTRKHRHILEIGCGQGTDGIIFCSKLPEGGSYRGIDYSDESIVSARRAAIEAADLLSLRVFPNFSVGNAESLELKDNSIDCVYSNGVLHHTANPMKAYTEIYRILKPGGTAYITLYRKPSIKVLVAKIFRGLQRLLSSIFKRERCLYNLFNGRHFPGSLGTMILECFGVPMMAWYSENEIRFTFSKFEILSLKPVGLNFPRRNSRSKGWSAWGYMWLVQIRKPLITG